VEAKRAGDTSQMHPAVLEPFLAAMRQASLDVEIVDETGWKLYAAEEGAEPLDACVSSLMWPLDESPVPFGERVYYLLDAEPVYAISIRNTGEDAMGRIALAGALLRALIAANGGLADSVQAMRQIMTERYDDTEIETLARDQKLDIESDRIVVLFHAVSSNIEGATRVLQTLFSQGSGDVVVPIDRHMVALCKAVDASIHLEDIEQLANAVDDSVQTETGISLLIGISEVHRHLSQMATALQEARSSISIGRAFHPAKRIFAFRDMILERFLSEADPEVMARYHALIFNRKYARLLSDEMISTIECFFACSLNLSEAARRLYIHRNTLVYRLDKFQRATGLDLRQFDDAVTLRILMMLGRSSFMRRGKA